MPFRYTEGQANDVPAWFTIFEAWIQTCGWTVVAGAGTTTLTLQSAGEAGGLTMLYAWVNRMVVTSRVEIQLRDDAAGTHVTTNPGYLETNNFPFYYWLNGDADCFTIAFKSDWHVRVIYAGLIIPHAITPADETYRMVVSNNFTITGSSTTILRHSTGAWDVDLSILRHKHFIQAGGPVKTSTQGQMFFPVSVMIRDAAANNRIAGSFKSIIAGANDRKHIGCSGDGLNSIGVGAPASTSSWIVLPSYDAEYAMGFVAMKKSGMLPTSKLDGNFASVHVGNPAPTCVNYYANFLTPFLLGRGWTVVPLGGVFTFNDMWSSSGENGLSDIHIRLNLPIAATSIRGSVMDATAARATTERTFYDQVNMYDAYISGDGDCVISTILYGTPPGVLPLTAGRLSWLGKVIPIDPNWRNGISPFTDYFCWNFHTAQLASPGVPQSRHLRGTYDDTWAPVITGEAIPGEDSGDGDHVSFLNSNPNAFDGVTYNLYPIHALDIQNGAGAFIYDENYIKLNGRYKYVYTCPSGAAVLMDTVTTPDGEVYVLSDSLVVGLMIGMRIV